MVRVVPLATAKEMVGAVVSRVNDAVFSYAVAKVLPALSAVLIPTVVLKMPVLPGCNGVETVVLTGT